MNRLQKAAFSMAEVVIVVAIVGLLLAFSVPSIRRAQLQANADACIEYLRQIEAAKEQWASMRGHPAGTPIEGAPNQAELEAQILRLVRRSPRCPFDTADLGYHFGSVGQVRATCRVDDARRGTANALNPPHRLPPED